MNYDIIFSDIDGTLLNDEGTISLENKKAIQYARDKGVEIVLTSGRSYIGMKKFAEQTNIFDDKNYLISFNGAIITFGTELNVIKEALINKQLAIYIVDMLQKLDSNIIIYTEVYATIIERDNIYTQGYYLGTHVGRKLVKDIKLEIIKDVPKIMVVGSNEELKDIEAKMKTIFTNEINIFFSGEYLLEFTSKDATKGKGIEYVANILNVPMEKTIAVGDNNNDISMIKKAGVGIAMKNATNELIANSKYVCEKTNDESGIAHIIYNYIK